VIRYQTNGVVGERVWDFSVDMPATRPDAKLRLMLKQGQTVFGDALL